MRSTSSSKRFLGCLTAGLLFLSPVTGQNAYAFRDGRPVAGSKKVSAPTQKDTNADRQTLFNVLKDLNKVKGVYFLFSDQYLGDKLVNKVSDFSKDIENILDDVLKGSGLKFKKVNDKTFVIVPENEKGRAGNEYHPVNFIQVEAESLKTGAATVADMVRGKVMGPDGSPLANVSVSLKGSTKGTSTNINGEFAIEAGTNDVLVFSSVGFNPQEVAVNGRTAFDVTLSLSNQQLNEVVVTALGIQRQSKSLSYSVQKINNAELTNVKDPNFINNLRGRVAGVTVNQSSSGVGGSTRVVLRGNKSTRENQPLYVVDGIPLSNYSPAQPGGLFGQAAGSGSAGLDAGDGISNVNPDDVESLTVLKGASAAALYGSQAANGVILITTKKGKSGTAHVDVSSELTFDRPLYKTPLQFKYGQTTPGTDSTAGSDESWGSVVNAPDHVSDFFQTGVTSLNSVSLTGGNDRSQSYLSYAYTDNKGILPNSYLYRHNVTFRQTVKFFNDRLVADANISFLNQRANNRIAGGYYGNPLIGLYEFPRGLNFNTYKDHYTYFSPLRNVNLQNWWNINTDKGYTGNEYEQNPYWLMKQNSNTAERNRAYAILSLKYNINNWLDIQARGNVDKSIDDLDSRYYAGTQSILASSNGRYFFQRVLTTQLYGDLIMSLHKRLTSLFMLSANIGTIFTDSKSDLSNFDTDYTNSDGGLRIANKFDLPNILPGALVVGQTYIRRAVHAAFASAQLNFKDYLYLDLTGRNDWSSTFAFTPTKNKGYFYYSAGLTAVLSDMVKMAEPISFAKVRVSYAKVGNDVSPYSTNPNFYNSNFQQGIQVNTKGPFPNTYLQPEDNRSFEVGTEWRFINDRVGVDFTYYVNNNHNQYLETAAGRGTSYTTFYFNGGNIRNNGVELSINLVPVRTAAVTWNSTINYAFNKNKIVAVARPDLGVITDQFILTGIGNENYESRIKQGGSWGDIYGYLFARAADGSIIVGDDGTPKKAQTASGSDSIGLIGNSNAKFTLGWNNSFDIGKFNLSFLIDGRFGGKVMSNTQALLDQGGYSKASADARDAGGVAIAASTASGSKFSGLLPAKLFYTAAGGRAGISEYYMYDATNVRVRELSLGYRIPENVKWISSLRVSLIARNLLIISKKAPFDPEVSLATSNAVQGIDAFGIPTTRSIGVGVKVGF